MTDRRDDDYDDDPLAPHETQAVRRTVDDVNEINDDRRFWQRVRKQGKGAVLWLLAAPVTLMGAFHGWTLVANQIAKWIGKAP